MTDHPSLEQLALSHVAPHDLERYKAWLLIMKRSCPGEIARAISQTYTGAGLSLDSPLELGVTDLKERARLLGVTERQINGAVIHAETTRSKYLSLLWLIGRKRPTLDDPTTTESSNHHESQQQ